MRVVHVRADVEDAYLTDDVVEALAKLYKLRRYWVVRHVLIDSLECDALIYGVMDKAFRTVGVELKRSDLAKLVAQAIKRRHLFHYMYMFIGMYSTDNTIRTLYRYGCLDQVLGEGIGIIVFEEGKPFIAVKSMFNPYPKYRPPRPLNEYVKGVSSSE